MVKWNYLYPTKDRLVENILENLYRLRIDKETCEELFNYAMYDNHTDESSRFISNIMLHCGIDDVRNFLLNEINEFDYKSERELYSFTSSRQHYEKAIEHHNTVKRLYNDIFN